MSLTIYPGKNKIAMKIIIPFKATFHFILKVQCSVYTAVFVWVATAKETNSMERMFLYATENASHWKRIDFCLNVHVCVKKNTQSKPFLLLQLLSFEKADNMLP